MKKILYLFAVLVAAFSVASCTPEVDNVFGKSAADRATEGLQNVRKILESAPNGWRMEYYGTSTFGGYNVLCKFSGEKVTFASERLGKNHVAGIGSDGKVVTNTVHYRLAQSQGEMLSFDDHSEIFHYFSNPKNPDGYGTSGDGFGGDFEFTVISATAEKVVLKGKKHQARIIMYPLAADQTWEDYLKAVDATENYMASRSYTFKGDGIDKVVKVEQSYRRLVFSYEDKGELKQIVAPYIVTPAGYIFYDSVKVVGVKFNAIARGTTDGQFYVVDNNKVWLESEIPPLCETLSDGQWFVAYSKLGAYAQPKWDIFHNKLLTASKDGKEVTLYWAMLGTFQKHVAFHFQADGDYGYMEVAFEPASSDGTMVTMKYNSANGNKNAKTYYKKYGLKEVMEPFGGKPGVGRTFKIETDNPRRPSYLKLTDQNEPTNIITLSAREVDLPFKN